MTAVHDGQCISEGPVAAPFVPPGTFHGGDMVPPGTFH
jgi:hypothetical protein